MSKDQKLWKCEEVYPALSPPTRLKKEILQNEDFRNVDTRARTAPDSSKESFSDLIEYLTKDLDSDLRKLRALFMWMGAQEIGTKQVEGNFSDVNSPRYYLKEAASISSFTDELFAKLCRGAGIPCILVDGKAKNISYEVGDDTIGPSNTWAVVYVDGSWRFVFPYWAFVAKSGHQKGNWMLVEDSGQPLRKRLTDTAGTLISHVEEFWFLTDPVEMNCFCHPNDDDKQLLTRTWAKQEFYSLPYYWKSYFSSGWNLLSPTQCIIKANRGLCEIEFQPPTSNSKLKYQLLFNEKHSGSRLPEEIQTKRYASSCNKDCGQRVSLLIRLPAEGRYKITVDGVHGSKTCSLVCFRINCDSVPPDTRPFPSQPEIGFGYGETAVKAGLSEPSHTDGLVLVKPGQEIHFSFKVQKDVQISASLLHAIRPPEELRNNVRAQQDEFSATVTVRLPEDDPRPEYSLEISTVNTTDGTDGSVKNFSNVVNYLLTSSEALSESFVDKTKELKVQGSKKIYDALAKDDAALFEKAVFDFDPAENDDPRLFEKVNIRKAQYEKILEELRASAKERDVGRFDNAIRACVRVNLRSAAIDAAKQELVLLCKYEVQKPIEDEKLNDLRERLDKVTNTCVGESVVKETWFQSSRDKLQFGAEEAKALDVIFAARTLLGTQDSQVTLRTWPEKVVGMLNISDTLTSSEECSLTHEQLTAVEERLKRHDWADDDGTIAKSLYKWCGKRIKLL